MRRAFCLPGLRMTETEGTVPFARLSHLWFRFLCWRSGENRSLGWSSGCFTGSNAASVYAGYQAVQNAQVELCNDASLNAFMGFDQAKNFYDPQNYRMDSGGIHYTQEGYKEMGEALAVKAVQVLNIELLPNVQENG